AGIPVIALQNPHLREYNGELYKDLLAQLLPPLDPLFILVAQTTRGLDFAPGLAARLKAGCMTGVNAVSRVKGDICFSRAAFNNKIVLDMVPTVKTAVLLIQPGAFKALQPPAHTPGKIDFMTSTAGPKKTRSLGIRKARQEDERLAQADVIVAAGRGIGKQENLALIKDLTALFPRSAVAGSRPLCDQNWLGYKSQVGQTGATVSPRLYISCGISGAIQHTVGMQGSGFIVAISTDPDAAIFNLADVCIVEDLTTFIPTFIEACHKKKGAPHLRGEIVIGQF
ncbi:MAG: electron transfer flavoprotein subunit alpha/FixB family protein, partial [Deltaproteobacteria bacterium]|nr:electron transfer flavoprotein subunit alpha/FixB family protein [Deltaproteobacteria bacterium]